MHNLSCANEFYLHENEKSFPHYRLSTQPSFDTEARANSEMAYLIDKILKLIYLIKYGHPQSLSHLIEFHRHAKFPLMGQNKISHLLRYPFISTYESLLMLGKKYHSVNNNNNKRNNISEGSSFPKQNRTAFCS